MLLKWIFKNKYKLMAIIIGLYLVADIVQHKGQARVLVPRTFISYKVDTSGPENEHGIINKGKAWIKAVNTKELLANVDVKTSGIECDVYFNPGKNIFEIHHDADKPTGFILNDLLDDYLKMKLQASIWLDFKNLDDSNCHAAVSALTVLRNQYGLREKILVESGRADLLPLFSDASFFTSYYIPLFNPYLISDDETKHWVDSISSVLTRSKVNALSGYYFQYPFLHNYFPVYPLLTWADNDRFSLVNWLFKRKVASAKEVFIILYP